MTLLDLFAGCGGLTQGFLSTHGFRPVGAVEHDRDAAATYAANFGDHVHLGDIAQWRPEDMPLDVDVVVGGPPCQGFSALGRQDPQDARSALWAEYLRVLTTVKPHFFVLENVPQFLASQQFTDLVNETAADGRLADYELEPHLLNAAQHGAGQSRRRAIVIGRPQGTAPLGAPPGKVGPTVRQVLRDVRPQVSSRGLPESRTPFRDATVPGIFKMPDLHITRAPRELSLERFREIPPGGNRFDLPEELKTPGWRRHHSGSRDVMGRLHWDRPSVTIRTEFYKPEKGRYLHPEQDRPITHYEAALLQGFPEHFKWCGTKISIARQIGNAVPVPLAESIARLLLERSGG